MTTDITVLRKQIRFRASRRGIKELDLMLGQFIDRYFDTLSTAELHAFADITAETDQDLFAYHNGDLPLPTHLDAALWAKISDKN